MSSEMEPIFYEQDEERLMEHGFMGRINSAGTRLIHKRLTYPTSNEEWNTHEWREIGPDTRDLFDLVPAHLISRAALEYLGFNTAKAAEVWHQWSMRDDNSHGPHAFVNFAIMSISPRNCRPEKYLMIRHDDASWDRYLQLCGVSDRFREAIMDEGSREVRCKERCLFWIRDTMEVRFRALEEMKRASWDRIMDRNWTEPYDDFEDLDSRSTMVSVSHPGMPGDTAMSKAAKKASQVPGCVTLFKAVDLGQVSHFTYTTGCCMSNPLMSRVESDRGYLEPSISFTVNRDHAMQQAIYIKNRSPFGAAALVQVTISNQIMTDLCASGLMRFAISPNPDWRRVDPTCEHLELLDDNLDVHKEALLVVGHLAGVPSIPFNDFTTYGDVVRSAVPAVTELGPPPVYYTFQGQEGIELFDKLIMNSLVIFPVLHDDTIEWGNEREEWRKQMLEFEINNLQDDEDQHIERLASRTTPALSGMSSESETSVMTAATSVGSP